VQGLVHIVDDDPSFLTAMQRHEARRLRGCRLRLNAGVVGSLAERRQSELHSSRRAATRTERSRVARAADGNPLDAFDQIYQRIYGNPAHGARLKGGCTRLSDQARGI
jgi:hypothetical protein